jgi:hypothetical protein
MSTIEGIIRQTTNNPLKMHDKIITVKPKGNPKLFRTFPLSWIVTSSHAKHLDLLTRRKSLDKVDLLCLTDLGFKIKHEN